MQRSHDTVLKKYQPFHPVVPFNRDTDKLLQLDFTASNTHLTSELLGDVQLFTRYINNKLRNEGARYGIGGYGEHRTIYSRSEVFDGNLYPASSAQSGKEYSFLAPVSVNQSSGLQSFLSDEGEVIEASEPRRLHLGIDIWGPVHTKVMAPLNGIVHSFGFHPELGNYGAVIILVHQIEGITFYTLYGHLSYGSIKNLYEGQHIAQGDVFAEFGIPQENGWWPPHLHFQVMLDMQDWKGDYPGVCAYSEREQWLQNCIDPDLILNLNRYAI